MDRHGSLNIATFVEASFQENAYVLWEGDGPDAWVVDPGLPPQHQQIISALRERELQPVAVVLTHCHGDHIAGAGPLKETFPEMQIWAPRDEVHMLTDPNENLSAAFGFGVVTPPADKPLAPGDELVLGGLTWRVLDVGGHSPGGLAFYCESAGVVITGDALFAGGIGRYDFPGSSGERLLRNIREQLLTLPPETVVYSGHGPATTVGEERDGNPFLQGDFEA